ncbi:hypothetical protein [Phocaeicola sp.]
MSNTVTTGSAQVKVDSDKVNAFFNALDLNNKERKKAIKAALRKSVLIIRKQAQTNLISAIPSAKTKGEHNGKVFKPLKNEINITVYKNASGARVDMIDRRKNGSRAYILRFFNQGTEERATKKGHNRGSIKATNFFANAVAAKKTEAEKSLEKNIIEMIQKAANKKK